MAATMSAYPLKEIPHPHPHDVLCGRGGGTNNHIGNSHWRMLVAANKQLYITLPKRQKMLLSRSIVNAVRSQNPPGRFLQKDSKTNFWFDVGDQRAQEKTSQALREGAPDIRNKIAQQKDKPKEGAVDSTETPTEKTPGDKPKADAATSAPIKKDEEKPTPTKSNDEVATPSKGKSSNSKPAAQAPAVPQAVAPGAMPAAQAPMMNTGFMPQMMPGQSPQFVMNGASMQQMNPNQMGVNQAGQPMMYYPGPNMAPMQMFPTMVVNEQGTLVPAMSVMPGNMMQNQMMGQQQFVPQANQQQQQQQQSQANSQTNNAMPPPSNNQSQTSSIPKNDQKPAAAADSSDLDPLPADTAPMTFDEYMAMLPPGALEPAGLSFGSITMTDAEQRKLESTGTSFGSVMSYNLTGNQKLTHPPVAPTSSSAAQVSNNQHPATASKGNNEQTNADEAAPAALDGLEPTGISFGDVSMMSMGTKGKLENTGTSFGSMMSYTAVEGGLEAIGTSFGSLSLDTTNRDTLFKSLEIAAAGPTIPPAGTDVPPIFQAQRSTGNLLECSDTESEDSDQNQQLVKQKSAAWENMQATFQAQRQKSRDLSGPGDNAEQPPAAGGGPQQVIANIPTNIVAVPATNFERDFSALSAWEMQDGNNNHPGAENDAAAMPPPPPMAKQDSDGAKLEMFYMQGDQFNDNNVG